MMLSGFAGPSAMIEVAPLYNFGELLFTFSLKIYAAQSLSLLYPVTHVPEV